MSIWNNIEQFYKKHGLRWLEKVLGKRALAPSSVDPSSIRRILVIRQHDYLGDFLLATPVLRALRERFPDAHIGLIVRDYFADAASGNRFVDEVIVIPGIIRTSSFLGLFRRLRANWDLAVVLNTVSHSLTSDLLAYFSTATFVLGSDHRVFPGCKANFFYNLRSPYPDGERHQTERNLDIVRFIGADTADLTEVMHLSGSETAAAQKVMAQMGIADDKPIAGLHLGAGKLQNRWPVERFVDLAGKLRLKSVQVVVFWGPTEGNLGEEFMRRCSFSQAAIQPEGLRALAAYFRNCDACVCNDTGVLHVCAAVGTPLVGIFGPTDPKEWKPLGEKFSAVQGKDGTTASVSSDDVLSLLVPLLEHSHARGQDGSH